MAYTLEEIEYLHDTGKMPDWIYYQMNGKTLQENYNSIVRKREAEFYKKLKEQERQKQQKELEAEIEKQAEKAIEKALEELLKDFGK